tara:strand:+ start:381 stop:1178 length:798 start_codon:yes stop_codon:yes gene_type:complete
MEIVTILKILAVACFITGCASTDRPIMYDDPYVTGTSQTDMLRAIAPLKDQPIIDIAVYDFPDMTGQRKPSTKFSQLSMAVSQGSDAWVIKALKEVAQGNFFRVVERSGLDNLVKERQLIRSTRELYDGDEGANTVLKPLLFAGLIVEGGIVGYDANVSSGGDGARYFGIGVHEEYRVDQVTVSMRLVSVQTGEVLLTAEATKSIASFKTGADVFRFLDLGTKALEIESGVASNEPVNYAVRSAIEYCVYLLLAQGDQKGYWSIN